MALDPLTAAFELGSKVIDRFFPNAEEAEKAKYELFKLQKQGELTLASGQMEINREEAKHISLFVSGWRPFVGWVCGFGLVYSFIGNPLLAWVSLTWGFATPPTLDLGTLLTVLGGLLGLGSLRTVEKINGVAAK